MGTGACGIDCNVCRLHVYGICSTCGGGTSEQGKDKLQAQMRLFNSSCPILACAVDKKLAHCMRDCDDYPCDHFSSGPYPYSEGFLEMQKRRRAGISTGQAAAWPENTPVFWEKLKGRDPMKTCNAAGATLREKGRYALQCLNETWHIDPENKTVIKTQGTFGGEWDRQMPFLILVYMAEASAAPLSDQMVAPRELYGGQNFFQARYQLEMTGLENTFGHDHALFALTGSAFGAKAIQFADATLRFFLFPKFPADYLLWVADEEFPAKFNILLPENLPEHYPFDTAAICLNLLTNRILMKAEELRKG